MKNLVDRIGLAAMRKAIREIANYLKSARGKAKSHLISGAILCVMLLSSCQEKTNGQQASQDKKEIARADSLHKPKVDIKVNRRYDEKGKLIGFDSTYTSYYSNLQGDTAQMDTLMDRFHHFFNRGQSAMFNRDFNNLFFRDSLLYPDFFHDDFFIRRYELNDAYMRNMMRHMDSVKDKFYQDGGNKPVKPPGESKGK